MSDFLNRYTIICQLLSSIPERIFCLTLLLVNQQLSILMSLNKRCFIASLKRLYSFSTLLLSVVFLGKFIVIIDMFNEELDTVKKLYDDGKSYGIPLNKYYPPVAGTLLWLNKLRRRISKPIEKFKIFEDDIVKTEDGMHVLAKADELFEILDKEQNLLFEEWCNNIPGHIEKNMNKHQLIHLANGCFSLNFDDILKAALREVKYLKRMDIPNIPEEALNIFDQVEHLTAAIMKLNRIVEWFNYLITNTTPFEQDLIDEELQTITVQVLSLTDVHTWYTNGE